MTPLIEPYLFFGGRCDEAIEFYQRSIGATLEMLMRFRENPQPTPEGANPPGWESKVMHASLRIGGCRVMVSDGCESSTPFSGFSLSISFPTAAEAERAFAALADGGRITMPISPTFWSPCFGMLTDRFGIGWMVTVAAAR